jgi:hypothetical protein
MLETIVQVRIEMLNNSGWKFQFLDCWQNFNKIPLEVVQGRRIQLLYSPSSVVSSAVKISCCIHHHRMSAQSKGSAAVFTILQAVNSAV